MHFEFIIHSVHRAFSFSFYFDNENFKNVLYYDFIILFIIFIEISKIVKQYFIYINLGSLFI